MSSFVGTEPPLSTPSPSFSRNGLEDLLKQQQDIENEIQYKSIYANEKDILKCQYNLWSPLLSDVCLKSTIIPLDQRFVDYLKADLTQLHPSLDTHLDQTYFDNLDSDGEEIIYDYKVIDPVHDAYEKQKQEERERNKNNEDSEEDSEEEEEEEEIPEFPELQQQLQTILEKYNNECFVKLNWSAPTDAVFMLLNNSPKCTSVHDIFLLLKSSNRVIFDLEEMFKDCHLAEKITNDEDENDIENLASSTTTSPSFDPVLVVKKWANLNPSQEFRVFVFKEEIVGICQRECTTYFDFLSTQKKSIEEDILKFYEEKIANRFNHYLKNCKFITLFTFYFSLFLIQPFLCFIFYLLINLLK